MTTDKINPASGASQANAELTLESIDLFIPDNSEANLTWLNMKDAAEFIGKSHAMIKLLVANKKVKSTKVKGKYGFEVRVDAKSLKDYYSSEDNSLDSKDKAKIIKASIAELLPRPIASITNENAYFKLTEQKLDNLSSELKIKNEQIKNLEINTNKLYEEIESKRSEQERILKLFENQQSLMLSLQQQMKTLTDAVTPSNFSTSRNDQNTNQKEDYVTEVRDNSKRKKWWFF
jgi:hypothetical protein